MPRELTIVRVPGSENPADVLGTIHLAQKEMHECPRRDGCKIAAGRSKLALWLARERDLGRRSYDDATETETVMED